MTRSINPIQKALCNFSYKIYGGHLPEKASQIPTDRLNDFLQRTNNCVNLDNIFDEYSFSGGHMYSKEPNVMITHLKNEIKVHNQNKKEGKPDDIITKKVLNSAKNCFIYTLSLPLIMIGGISGSKLIKNPKAELLKCFNKTNRLGNLIAIPLILFSCGMLALQMSGMNLLGEARMLKHIRNKSVN